MEFHLKTIDYYIIIIDNYDGYHFYLGSFQMDFC